MNTVQDNTIRVKIHFGTMPPELVRALDTIQASRWMRRLVHSIYMTAGLEHALATVNAWRV